MCPFFQATLVKIRDLILCCRTSKQQDFAADRLANVKAPVRAGRPKDSETAALIHPGFLTETSAARPNKAQIQVVTLP